MLSLLVKNIRKNWAKADAMRDKGLETPECIMRHDNLSYGPYGAENLLDIYYKKDATSPQPSIINIHGGGWVYGSKEIYQFYCMELAKRGFTVVNINYRLAPESKYPAPLEDISRAFSFLIKDGAKYMIDTDNLFMLGDSAGAQLAFQYAVICSNPEYAALFDFTVPDISLRAISLNCGIYDFRQIIDRSYGSVCVEYIGKQEVKNILHTKVLPENMRTLDYVTANFPPTFVMSAENDSMLPHAGPMHQFLTEAGVQSELHIYGTKEQKEISHVFHVNCRLEEATKCNDAECNFFKKFIISK